MDINNLTAVAGTEKDFLGHLTWYSIGKQLIQTDDLENKLIQAGLDKAWMPNPIRSTDAFRRATKEVERRQPTSQPHVYENILVREVYSDRTSIQRNLVIETVDQNGKRLSYDPKSAVITLEKESGSVTFVSDDSALQEVCVEAKQKFDIYKDHYSAQQLRVMVSKILNSLAPTPVRRNGGIYFVPSSKSEGLHKLIRFIESLENSEGYKVPVIDSSDNRNMVNKKLHEHFTSLLDSCRNSTGLTKGEMKALVDEANRVIKDYRNYKTIVANDMESIEEVIANVRQEVIRLATDMKTTSK